MNISCTEIPGVVIVTSTSIADHRGTFFRSFCMQELSSVIGNRHIVQMNLSNTHSVGTVRGMHFQSSPFAEMKLVRCLRGRVWDVAVDLRAGSSTFLKWHAEELTPKNLKMMVIPEGCAHGFQILAEDSQLLYLHTAYYTPSAEGGVRYDDPKLNISWPLPVTELSTRDLALQPLMHDFSGILV